MALRRLVARLLYVLEAVLPAVPSMAGAARQVALGGLGDSCDAGMDVCRTPVEWSRQLSAVGADARVRGVVVASDECLVAGVCVAASSRGGGVCPGGLRRGAPP